MYLGVTIAVTVVLLFSTDLILKEETAEGYSLKFNFLDSINKSDSIKDMGIFQLTNKFDNLEENYLEFHQDAILVDSHNDFIWQAYNKGVDFGRDNRSTQTDLPKFK